MKELDQKINELFAGKVVRKDLTNLIKGNASIPTYVLEYLLGQYAATDDEETIREGVETVKSIITKHFVHRDEAQVIKSTVRERGSHRIIDKVAVKLNDKKDIYEAYFGNLGLNKVPIQDSFVKKHPKLLSGGVWCIVTLGYQPSEERDAIPWTIEKLKPIQISGVDLDEYKELRQKFTTEEWINLLMQSIGLNPEEFSDRSKLLQLARLIPFAEKNYNLIELGPKGTGKSHLYSELSPHGILISGGEVSKAKLFVNNSTGEIGLVGYWDVVAYDEFAGKTKKADRGLVDILKNYMANKNFSRGTQVYQAEASMVYVGNTDHSVPYMLKHSDLFDALPKDYYDSAFLDRIHCYLPGWEVQKLRNEMFTSDYGFIVDYLAEIMKDLRKEDYMKSYQQYFELSDSITTRDKTAIEKTFSGLIKVIYPHGEFSASDAKELLDFAIEGRKRVKDQLRKMDETFNDEVVRFQYKTDDGSVQKIETLEVIEYGDHKLNIPAGGETDGEGENIPNEDLAEEKKEKSKKELKEGQKIIRENQTGVSYQKLFGDYLEDATEIEVIDPYIRLPYQLKNFMELARLIAELKEPDEEVSIHLKTNNNEEYLENAREAFSDMSDSLEPIGVKFTYEFDEDLHDRSITLDNGWKIVLGRGLDIFQKTNGWFDIADHYQEVRKCKGCEITYLREG
ncbi:BREX system Lon protease-like protein BrxL [Rhodohalobacter sulfatireducens]|uniref:BREX system Lon protease-like protein BrxL n=1 Tax=Rhodohalobacter sulfatireducens TaxID=2911366 RepID=A0ABS9KAA7_9BACT|nr:BREX system Lon protease-like protein BrxL [Rhodohalobacter sulfatireducens]MCG2587765.1 BREX system Lon protease-like protein BrxL [Rhodohalobacter sulfatireducens]